MSNFSFHHWKIQSFKSGLFNLDDNYAHCFIYICMYFSSFEAGIANAISSFKWRKIVLFMKNRHRPKLNDQFIWLNEYPPQSILPVSVAS